MGLIISSTFGLLHGISASRLGICVTGAIFSDAKTSIFARANALIASAFKVQTPAFAIV